MPTFRDTAQRRQVVEALISLVGRPELLSGADPVEAAWGLLDAGTVTGSEEWLVRFALWMHEPRDVDVEEPGFAGFDLLDAPRQHAVATLLEALAKDALIEDEAPGQEGAAVDFWLREHDG